jgi:hypothetical protein
MWWLVIKPIQPKKDLPMTSIGMPAFNSPHLTIKVATAFILGCISSAIAVGVISLNVKDEAPVSVEDLQSASPCIKEVLRRTYSNMHLINAGEYRRAGAACFDQPHEVRAQQAALDEPQDRIKQWK